MVEGSSIPSKRIHLNPWEEIIGLLTGIGRDLDGELLITIETKSTVAIDADTISERELMPMVGKQVAILRTDSPKESWIVRTVRSST